MQFDEFEQSTLSPAPPAGLSPYLTSLWHAKRGEWTAAHDILQDIEDTNGSWVHAYLHRYEGDHPNANYWYQRAGKLIPHERDLDAEWRDIVTALL
ncbi:MAG: hypothetical protein ACKV2V_12005 [Blastocatellia bacterium]